MLDTIAYSWENKKESVGFSDFPGKIIFQNQGKGLKCKEAELYYHVNPFEYQRTDQADGML